MIDWKDVEKEQPKEKKELFLFGYTSCKISLSPNANQVIRNVFRTGEFNGEEIIVSEDMHPVFGFPYWQFTVTHWTYAEKPLK